MFWVGSEVADGQVRANKQHCFCYYSKTTVSLNKSSMLRIGALYLSNVFCTILLSCIFARTNLLDCEFVNVATCHKHFTLYFAVYLIMKRMKTTTSQCSHSPKRQHLKKNRHQNQRSSRSSCLDQTVLRRGSSGRTNRCQPRHRHVAAVMMRMWLRLRFILLTRRLEASRYDENWGLLDNTAHTQ